MENFFLGCGDRNLGSLYGRRMYDDGNISIDDVKWCLLFCCLYEKRKNNKEKEMGYKVIFAVVFFLLSVPFINMVITG